MDRRTQLLRGIDKVMLGLEIAPWFNPLVAKRDGYNVRTLDVFEDSVLMERAVADGTIPPEDYPKLEPVDYVGSATEVAALVDAADHGTFDYVISSHNFEHLPNPIKFLQGCERILKPGGQLIMALPDGRACFDYFRPHTDVSEWLEAFLEDRTQPNGRQIFAFWAGIATSTQPGVEGQTGIGAATPAHMIEADGDLTGTWDAWKARGADAPYVDTHCSVFTPSSFRLLIEDCRSLSLTRFRVEEVSDVHGMEFFARLTLGDVEQSVDQAEVQARRTALLRAIWSEQALRQSDTGKLSLTEAAEIRAMSDWERVKLRLRDWNRKRRQARRARRGGS